MRDTTLELIDSQNDMILEHIETIERLGNAFAFQIGLWKWMIYPTAIAAGFIGYAAGYMVRGVSGV